jgi:hypothetical protein
MIRHLIILIVPNHRPWLTVVEESGGPHPSIPDAKLAFSHIFCGLNQAKIID